MSVTPGVINVMTVDVEDYFHVSAFDGVVSRANWDGFESRVSRNTDELLAIFDRAGVRSTFFVLGWVAERFPSLVRRIADLGHEVASHGFHHQLLYLLTPAQFRDDIRAARRAIEDAAGQPVMGYRAPSYSVIQPSLWAIDILIEEGYAYDASIFPIHHDRYGIPESPRHPYRVEAGRRFAARVAWIHGPSGSREPADRGRRLLQTVSVHVDEVGHRPRESRRAAAGGVLSASLGNRSLSNRGCRLERPGACATIVVSIKHADGSSGC